ncbi:FAD-dependent oxidoreductase [Aquicoccus sp. SCR17]|nr:FAD-dependent oxidoreductase [Carideicomes alvinocaridis]
MLRVAIAGAGPTGLTAALELARRGAQVEIFERRDTPSPFSRAVGILPRSMEILRPSGVAERIAAEAVRFEGLIIHRGARRLARVPLNFDAESRIWGLAQDRTETHLSDALRHHGVEVRYGDPVEGFAADATGVTVRSRSGETRADWLIGADGVHSTVRQAMGVAYPGHDLPGDWSIADVDAEGWPNAAWFNGFLLPGGDVCVVVPLERARFRIISSRPDALKALPVPMNVTHIRRSGSFTISIRQVERYRQGRVVLAGDAAHCHSPVGGRGMNLGIADAAELAQRLLEGRMEGYAASRHAAGAHVIAQSERGRRLLQAQRPPARMAVTGLLRLAGAAPPLGRALARQLISG